ncbi:MAG: hypothetical protein ACLVML_10535 [Candidatus Gastranaerophilaceae bacterium]|nr:hypothetical protein [Christensenellales bacterium]
MKRYNKATRVLVDFDTLGQASPVFFIASCGERAKVSRVISVAEERWGYKSFIRFRIEFNGRNAELCWDRSNDRWFLTKEGA